MRMPIVVTPSKVVPVNAILGSYSLQGVLEIPDGTGLEFQSSECCSASDHKKGHSPRREAGSAH